MTKNPTKHNQKWKSTGDLDTNNKIIEKIGINFDIEKCAMMIMICEEGESTERIEVLNLENIRTLGEKEKFNYVGILKADTIKEAEMKEKIRK